MKNKLFELIKNLEKIVPYASVMHKKSTGTRVNVNKMQESVDPVNPSEGLVVTLWNGQQFYERAVNQWDWETLSGQLKEDARHVMSAVDKNKPVTEIDPGPSVEKDFSNQVKEDPAQAPLEKKLKLAKDRLHKALDANAKVANAMSVQGDVTRVDIFCNRNKMMSQKITRVDAMMMIFVSDGQRTVEVFGGVSKNGGLEAVDLTDEKIESLVRDGIHLLGTERLKPGTYDIVTDPDWSGIIAHECFGHGMETDLYVRERALSQQYLGKPIASPIVNMFDDPSLIEEAGGFFFDDEGQLSSSTHIIKDGILQRGLTDMASAHKLKMVRSANGRRESFKRKAYARMTNTFFANGKHSKDEIISSVKEGLYLRHATNGMEDPQAWGIQVEGLWAEEIKNGKLTGKVYSPIIMTGFVPDLLKSISMVGNDGHISGLGMCGKGHKEWVKNTTGGPHLKMRARLA